MKKIILSAAILVTFMSGCKKKDDPAPTAPTKTTTEYLTAHSWKTTNSVSNINVDTDDDPNTPDDKNLWNHWSACEKDDILTFSTNGTGTYSDAGTACPDDGSFDFTWILSGNTLVITNTDSESQTTIIDLVNDNTLKLSFSNDWEFDVTIIETDIFSK